MLANEPYRSSDPELVQARTRARLLLARFNASS
ncbi:MAG: acetyltransferase, partial [Candidatus Competibacter sp.]|nr:acetyltransferase [Candidatus Competibacter sp.]